MIGLFLADVLIVQPDVVLERCLVVFGGTKMVTGDMILPNNSGHSITPLSVL